MMDLIDLVVLQHLLQVILVRKRDQVVERLLVVGEVKRPKQLKRDWLWQMEMWIWHRSIGIQGVTGIIKG